MKKSQAYCNILCIYERSAQHRTSCSVGTLLKTQVRNTWRDIKRESHRNANEAIYYTYDWLNKTYKMIQGELLVPPLDTNVSFYEATHYWVTLVWEREETKAAWPYGLLFSKRWDTVGVWECCVPPWDGRGLGWEEPDAPGPPPVLQHGLSKSKKYIQSIFHLLIWESLRPSCNFDWRHEHTAAVSCAASRTHNANSLSATQTSVKHKPKTHTHAHTLAQQHELEGRKHWAPRVLKEEESEKVFRAPWLHQRPCFHQQEALSRATTRKCLKT